MMQLRLGFTFAIASIALAGCNSLSLNNHSLDYKKASNVAPLELPANATMRPFTPLYPAPIVDDLAIQHAPNFENKRGNRYAAPRPEQVQAQPATASNNSMSMSRPRLVTDGNKNPLLQIDGPSEAVWQYTMATLSSMNYTVIVQDKNAYQATIKVGEQVFVLRLTAVGTSNNLALFTPSNSFADTATANQVLNQINQNWPA